MDGCDRSTKGKTIIQLSTGIPEEAREVERSLRSMGANYLDGAILAYPEHIGTSEATIFVSGEEDAYQHCEHLLRALAGGTIFVGSAIGQASALDSGILCAAIGAYLGAIHGARICEAEGLSVRGFGEMLAELAPMLGGEIKHINERIASDSFDGSHATLQTYAGAARRLLQHAKGSSINTSFPSYAASILELGEREGLGQQDLAALITVIRKEGEPNKAMESDT
jgi:3-hydroxyisobutyrate dehydrogenase-like beta-hydroxyacid dehydrogenase